MTHTDEAMRDLWISDIAAIKSAVDLRVWASRWARDLIDSPFRDEVREAFRNRMKELGISR